MVAGLALGFSEGFPGIAKNDSWAERSSLNGFSRVIKVAPERKVMVQFALFIINRTKQDDEPKKKSTKPVA